MARYMRSCAALNKHDSPEGQLLHDPGPGTFLYVPEEQAVHVPPFGPVYPSLHLHADKVSLPGDEAESAMMPLRQLTVLQRCRGIANADIHQSITYTTTTYHHGITLPVALSPLRSHTLAQSHPLPHPSDVI